ncbi:MAG: LPS export ABC transporter ATP-binding protein [Nitrospirae bacterium]|uniref:LPS export ABC transporter ATP-binding protein n=1 Tax=Candidatus Magnetobacterium casense TaxID=1455061 RepID=UPI00058C6002|nr:LPS export ABC transporter ATP-binding protein [Candidatus Magnetobacterium casensis]MBF0338560.1 LPS export ABC transporter ATP-binding protein [Nitrospirota bacterium]
MDTITVTGLKKSYSKKTVVQDLSLTLNTGEIVGLLGPNGAGKTTTFHMLTGIIRQDHGSIYLNDEEIGNQPMYLRARKGITYLPQEASIFRKLSVRDNIRAVLELTGKDKVQLNDTTQQILDEFKLSHLSASHGYTLSGGERRRTEIARAIATEPTFILFDEPFTGIDPIAIIELKKMLLYLKDRGLGILITDHNVRDTLSITDRAYIISHGRVLDEGTPQKIISNHTVKQAYLGEDFTL